MSPSEVADLRGECDLLRSLHCPGSPLVLPNVWDVASARVVVAAGFPVVATSSEAVAAVLGFEDEERAPAEEMLAAASRIANAVEVPVTVDAQAGYGMEPSALVAALREVGAAGCNLEDSDHEGQNLRDPDRHADWLRAVREAASDDDYPLVINARVDSFFAPYLAGLAGADPAPQDGLVADAVERANAYVEAGVDCVYPICIWEPGALRSFMSEARGPVNVAPLPEGPTVGELATLGVARVSWGPLLHWDMLAWWKDRLASLRE